MRAPFVLRLLRTGSPLALALGLVAGPAAAHFLWLDLSAGTRTSARLSFGETPDESTLATLLPRLATASVRDGAGGKVEMTEGEGRWTGLLPGTGPATAHVTWGVVDRGGEVFLLEYYGKAVAGLDEAGGDLGQPLEVIARRDGARVVARVRWDGQGVPKSPVHVHLPSGKTLDLTASEAGEVSFDLEGDGVYGIRARKLEQRKGELEGKAFAEVRHYATLTFGAVVGTLAAQPAGQAAPAAAPGKPAAADPVAYALLKNAHDSRQVMPPDDPGFRCGIVFQEGEDVHEGQIVYRKKGPLELTLGGVSDASLGWVRNQILNQVGHRRGGDFAEGDGKYPLQLGPEDGSLYGRLIVVNDDMESSYRVRDNKVLEVTRVGDGMRFTISVIETMDADDGKYLANHFVVSYRDEHSGALKKFEGYRDRYAHIDGLWLPAQRTVIEVTDQTSPMVRTIRYRDPVRLEPAQDEAAAQGG